MGAYLQSNLLPLEMQLPVFPVNCRHFKAKPRYSASAEKHEFKMVVPSCATRCPRVSLCEEQDAHLIAACRSLISVSFSSLFFCPHLTGAAPPRKHHALARSWWFLFAAVAPTLQTPTMSSLPPPARPRPSPSPTTLVTRTTRMRRGGWSGARRVRSVGSPMERPASNARVPSTVTRTAKGK